METVYRLLLVAAAVAAISAERGHSAHQHKNSSQPKDLGIVISGHVSSHTQPLRCPKRFIKKGNACFQASAIRATWAEAQIYCRSMHKRADLASLVTPFESEEVKRYLRQDPELRLRSFWVGGNRVKDTQHWEWLSTRKRLNWSGDWYVLQPDNSGNSEFCILMDRRFEHQWNDMPCHIPQYFLCEIRNTHHHRQRRRRLRKFLH